MIKIIVNSYYINNNKIKEGINNYIIFIYHNIYSN